MCQMKTYQLCHPELLSEVTLREILENRCIALPKFENLKKEELIEIFKRIAMPLPQRKYNESRNLGKKLNDLRTKRGIRIASSSEDKDIPVNGEAGIRRRNKTVTNESHANIFCRSIQNSLFQDTISETKKRLKPPIEETREISKKIHLSDSCRRNNTTENETKRKHTDVSPICESKKRQKITWP